MEQKSLFASICLFTLVGVLIPQIAFAGVPRITSPSAQVVPTSWKNGPPESPSILLPVMLLQESLSLLSLPSTHLNLSLRSFSSARKGRWTAKNDPVRAIDSRIFNLTHERERHFSLVGPIAMLSLGGVITLTALPLVLASLAGLATGSFILLIIFGALMVGGIILLVVGIRNLVHNINERKSMNGEIRRLKGKRQELLQQDAPLKRLDGPPPPGGDENIPEASTFNFPHVRFHF